MGKFSADYFSVTPDPLEVVGVNVPARVSAKIPAKFFVKNAEVTVTPTLVYNGQEATSQPYTFQGEKVRGNYTVISYDNGGYATIPVNFTYQPQMAKSELYLDFNVDQNGKKYVLPRVKVADGIIATAALADAATVAPAIAPDKFQRIINEKYAADIMFLINQANIRAGQLKTDAMLELQKEIIAANGDNSRVLEEINISSYASPDGGVKLNTKLAENREKNTKDYMQKQLKKIKSLNSANSLPSSPLRTGKASRNSFSRATSRTKTSFSAFSRCTKTPNSANVKSAISPMYSSSSPTKFFLSSATRASQLL